MTRVRPAAPVISVPSLRRWRLSAIALSIGVALAIEAQADPPRFVGTETVAEPSADGMSRRRALEPAHRLLAMTRATSSAPTRPATTLTVQNCDDSGAGSLRDVIAAAVDGDTVDLGQLACSSITLTSGEIRIMADVDLAGPADGNLAIHGSNDRVFFHNQSGTLGISNLTVDSGKYEVDGDAFGGCIASTGYVSLVSTTVSHCIASGHRAFGGAVYAARGVTLLASTISYGHVASSNYALTAGGGIATDGPVTAKYSTIDHNTAAVPATGGFAWGGGIYAGSPVQLIRTTVSNNTAGDGAALFTSFSNAYASIDDSTISSNDATACSIGGAIALRDGGAIRNSTIAFNTSSSATNVPCSAGLGLLYANADLQSAIVAENMFVSSNAVPEHLDIAGPGLALTGANNLVEHSDLTVPAGTLIEDPLLGPLADNGGPTLTHALLADSPAIDSGNNVAGESADQRGGAFARVAGIAADIGAFEFVEDLPAPPTIGKAFAPAAIVAGAASTLTITLGNDNASAATLTAALTDTLPEPLVIAAPANASTTCPAGVVVAAPGSGAVTLAASAAIPANGSCTISVDVTAASPGILTNVIATGQLQTDAGDNTEAATADISVDATVSDPIFTNGFDG